MSFCRAIGSFTLIALVLTVSLSAFAQVEAADELTNKPDDAVPQGIESDIEEAVQPEAAPETAEKSEAEEGMLGGEKMIVVTNRTSVGVLGSDLLAEYGFQVEATSKHFGVFARWANFQPYPDKIDFSWNIGFGFHYYPFGEGPKGLYVGPGFMFAHITKQPDPMAQIVDWLQANNERIANGGKAEPMFFTTGYGHEYDLLTPFLEIGYRYYWPESDDAPVYFITGVEVTVGYAISDQTNRAPHSFLLNVNPMVGLTW